MDIQWLEQDLTVIINGQPALLLPKEYVLLQFLYRNRGQVFSREQLLDQVWPMEFPVERTVDDHIYRLRKKLSGISGLSIKTVRGFGYSLTVQVSTATWLSTPTTGDAEMQETMLRLLGTYHKYGQGRSLLTLARQQDVLGYEMDPFYRVCVHFVEGDLAWLLFTEEVGLQERLYYLVVFYLFMGGGQAGERLAFCERVLDQKILAPAEHMELKILNILLLYALAGQPQKALDRLKLTHQVIADPNYESFVPVTAIAEMSVHLIAGTADEQVEAMCKSIDELLAAKPYLREIGQYHVAKGLWRLRQRAWREAERLLDEGLQVLEMSGFVPMRCYVLQQIVQFSEMFSSIPALRDKYAMLLHEEYERMDLPRLRQPLEELLRIAVSSL